MAHFDHALSRAWKHTLYILFQPFRLSFWFKAALLALLIKGFVLFSTESLIQNLPSPDNIDQWADKVLQALPLLVGIMTAYLLYMIVLEAFSACARFLFLDAIRDGSIHYGNSLQRHITGIVSLFLWNVAIKLLFGLALIVCLAILLIPNVLLGAMSGENPVGLIIALTLDALFALLVLLLIFAHSILLNGLVVPQMAMKATGIMKSWKEAFRLLFAQPTELIGFALIRLSIIIANIIANAMVVYSILLFLYLLKIVFSSATGGFIPNIGQNSFFDLSQLFYQIILAALLLPFPMLIDCYSLCFLAKAQNDSEYEPKNRIFQDREYTAHDVKQDPPSQFGTSKFISIKSDPLKRNETHPFRGPVSFKDIPIDTINTKEGSPKEENPPSSENNRQKDDQPRKNDQDRSNPFSNPF